MALRPHFHYAAEAHFIFETLSYFMGFRVYFVTAFISLIFVGISHLVYIIPAITFYWRDGRRGVMKGMIIAAAIRFLLNAACTVLLFGNPNIH